MGRIAGAFATSHAFTFLEPSGWDEFRTRNRDSFQKRRGRAAPVRPEIERETDAAVVPRFQRIRAAHDAVRAQIAETNPDVLILIGDDQNENLTSRNIPQIGIYSGGEFQLSKRWGQTTARFQPHAEFAQALLEQGVEDGFDLASLGGFENDELMSHAHAQVLEAFVPEADIPVVLIFINAIHPPALTPKRCFELGQLIGRVVAARPTDERAMICASGGLSHFTAGYPWRHYTGPFDYGSISESFDRQIIEHIQSGHGAALAELTSADLLTHGDIELRAWIALLGALGPVPSQIMVYEPFYRAIMGMAVATWPEAA
jgi:hypothetical protein